MMPSEPLSSAKQIKPLPQRPHMAHATNAQDYERWANLFARTSSAEAATADLAYGCVDWYLYSGEPLQSVRY
jgi:hypothetical protein